MTDKPNYSLKDLLNELKEKEKELAEINKKSMLFQDSYDRRILLQAEISALKKGIQACEERDKEILEESKRWYGYIPKGFIFNKLKQQLTEDGKE